MNALKAIDQDSAWLNNLRVIATISVILLHVAAPYVLKFGELPLSSWLTAHAYDSLTRFCVPIFVMITGALLLPRTDTLSDFLKRRMTRILLPFLFWTCCYVLFDLNIRLRTAADFDYLKFVIQAFRNGAAYHFWYIYMIVGIYLFIPILRRWISAAPEKEICYFLMLWVVTLVFTLPWNFNLLPNFNLSNFTGYIGYAVLGYYLATKDFTKWKYISVISFAIFVIGTGITFYGTYLLTVANAKFVVTLYQFLSINVMLSAAGLFLWIKHLQLKNLLLISLRNFINTHSFGIYFVHVMVLYIFAKLGLSTAMLHPLVGIPLLAVFTLIVSAAIVFVLKKIPYAKLFIG